MTSARIDAVLDQIEILRGQERQVTPLAGGLSNRSYRVRTRSGTYVVRIAPTGTDLLAIDRDREYLNSLTAAQAGVGPAVADYRPGEGVLVLEFIDGDALTESTLPAQLTRVAEVCRRLHSGPRFAGDYDIFAVRDRYRNLVQEHRFRVPPGYDRHWQQVEQIRRALAVRAEPTVPCHNDLVAANFIDREDRLWLIDFEYAGNNDACFELGNLAAGSGLSVDATEQLVRAYYRRDPPSRVARARLYGLLAQYIWTLWAAIQQATSEIDFDYWGWGMQRFAAAQEQFAGPDFARLLELAVVDDLD